MKLPPEFLPIERGLLTPSIEPLEECADADKPEVRQPGLIEADPEIVKVTAESRSCIDPELLQRFSVSHLLHPAPRPRLRDARQGVNAESASILSAEVRCLRSSDEAGQCPWSEGRHGE